MIRKSVIILKRVMPGFRLLCLVLIILASCKKNGSAPVFQNVKGILVTTADCQRWLIHKYDSTAFQPLNLDSFKVTLKSGQPVIFSYTPMGTGIAICVNVTAIQLRSIQDQ
jgi:hypothetical protein